MMKENSSVGYGVFSFIIAWMKAQIVYCVPSRDGAFWNHSFPYIDPAGAHNLPGHPFSNSLRDMMKENSSVGYGVFLFIIALINAQIVYCVPSTDGAFWNHSFPCKDPAGAHNLPGHPYLSSWTTVNEK